MISEVKHKTIEDDLVAGIESGRLHVGMRIPPVRSICKDYGVSRGTAHKAISTLMNKGYLEGVQGQGTFVREWSRETNSPQCKGISIVCPADEAVYVELLDEASSEAERHGYHVSFSSTSTLDDRVVPLIIRKKRAVGNLILGELSEQQAEVLLAQDLPQMFLGNTRQTFGRPCVRHDMEDAGYQITKKMLERNQGPVWLVLQPTTLVYYSLELLQGYERAIIECPDALCHVHISRSRATDTEVDDHVRLVEQIKTSCQGQFCVLGAHGHIRRLVQEFAREGIDISRNAVTMGGESKSLWSHPECVNICDVSPRKIVQQGVRQMAAMAQTGAPLAGKTFRLHIETVDDEARPWRFVWK